MSVNGKFRTAIIGTGRRAREDYLPVISQSRDFDLCALCDTDIDSVQQLARTLDVKAYRTAGELLRSESIDTAIVSAPHSSHFEITAMLAKAGIHVIKEKPFALNMKEALALEGLIKASGIKLVVMLQRRFDLVFQAFHRMKEQIGRVYSIEGRYTMNVPRLDLGWRASSETAGGGALLDMGYHSIDLLVWYFGLPASVSAKLLFTARETQKYDVEDTVHLLFEYKRQEENNGRMVGSLVVSRAYPTKKESLLAIGTKGVIELERDRIRCLTNDGRELQCLERTEAWTGAFAERLDYFARLMRGDEPERLENYYEHFQHVAIIEAAYQSSIQNRSVSPRSVLESHGIQSFA